MRIRPIIILAAVLALGTAAVSAQPDAAPEPRRSGFICDWGLLVVEEAAPAQAIEITEPADFSGVGTSFTLAGEAAGIFENNVEVEVLDTLGRVLFSATTTAETAEVGGRGPWSLAVDLGEVPRATRVFVRAFATSPADGEIVAIDTIALNANSAFGLSYIDIVSPADGADVAGAPLVIEGTAGALFENGFVIEVADADGNLLAHTPVTFDAPDVGQSGPWSAELDFDAGAGSALFVTAYALSMEDGETVVASDRVELTVEALRRTYGAVLLLQSSDPLLSEPDRCATTSAEITAAELPSVVHVTAVRLVESLSLPPQLTLEIDVQMPSFCRQPLRVRVVRDGDAYTGDIYRAGPDGICTRDLRESTVVVPLGAPPSGAYTAAVNGVSAD